MNPPRRAVFGIILAAGLATRFGADKLLHNLSGNRLFLWSLKAALNSKLTGIVIVCQEKLLSYVPSDKKLHKIVNCNPQRGQSSSLRLGLSALPDHCSHTLVLLADQPLISAPLINRFVAMAQTDVELACLSTANYLGPPALFSRIWFGKLNSLSGDSGARKILNTAKNLQLVSTLFKGQELDLDRLDEKDKLEDLLRQTINADKG